MELLSSFFDAIQTDPSAFLLELMGAISGLVCVWLLIKENIWTWPLGLVYALISLFVFYEARLFSDWLLHLYYVGMNGYGWYYWSRSSKQRTVDGDIAIIHMPIKLVFFITIVTLVSVVVWGLGIEKFAPTADLIYWDSTTTVLSFTAMWRTARKYLESWIVWLVIDILLAGIYFYKGIFPYAFLYTVYIGLAVAGWMRWSRSVNRIGVEQSI